MKKILIVLFLLLTLNGHSQLIKQRESYYQNLFATVINGKTEYVLPDLARIDIITDTFAVEVDFADKWAEGIGQSIYYAKCTNKKPGILLIVDGNNDSRYILRILKVAENNDITLWLLDYNTNKWRRVKTYHTFVYNF